MPYLYFYKIVQRYNQYMDLILMRHIHDLGTCMDCLLGKCLLPSGEMSHVHAKLPCPWQGRIYTNSDTAVTSHKCDCGGIDKFDKFYLQSMIRYNIC